MDKFSYLGNGDVSAFETLYEQYKTNPDSVDSSWQAFFKGFEFQTTDYSGVAPVSENMNKEFKVISLINDYRFRGHLFTKTNPVRERRQYSPTLAIENYGLSEKDLNTTFQAGEEVGIGPSTLKDIINHLELTYCQSIGIEYAYIRTPKRFSWIKNKIELKNRPKFNTDEKSTF